MKKRNSALGKCTVIYLGFGACAVIAITALMLTKPEPPQNQGLATQSKAAEGGSGSRNKETADSTSVTAAPKSVPARPSPEPPAKPWKCTFHETLPDDLIGKPPSPRITSGDQSNVLSKNSSCSFRTPEIPIPFAEFEHMIRLDDSNILFVWAATEKTFPAIDKQHQRVVQAVFGPVDEPAESHYVFSIRDVETDEITVISIPIPKDMMVEVLGWLKPQAPGWIAINTRRDGADSPTPGWLHIGLEK